MSRWSRRSAAARAHGPRKSRASTHVSRVGTWTSRSRTGIFSSVYPDRRYCAFRLPPEGRMSPEVESARLQNTPLVRPMRADDLAAADRVLRLAFGTIRGLSDPSAAFGDADYVHTRFRAAPECAWVAEIDGDVVGSVFAACWGSFGFFGPLSVDPSFWDRGIGSRLLRPVLEAFASWDVRQAGLFTFADSAKHLGLYQKHGFWPGSLTVVTAKETGQTASRSHALVSHERENRHSLVLDEIRGLTDQIFRGL